MTVQIASTILIRHFGFGAIDRAGHVHHFCCEGTDKQGW